MKKIVLFILLVTSCLFFSSCFNLDDGLPNVVKEKYEVRFETNEGASVSSLKVDMLTEAPAATREAHIFCGWFLDRELKNPVVYPLSVDRDMTLYAKWTKTTDQLVLDNAAVQFDVNNDRSYKAEYIIVPAGLDIQSLAEQGYSIQIDVTYDVYYVKDYDVPFDLGYQGAPEHDVSIVDNYDEGEIKTDLSTSSELRSECISAVVKASDILKNSIRLRLMTYNMQNVVHFKNIVVSYTCLEK